MRTTLDFDDRLLREAKALAAARGQTLTGLIEQALRAFLRRPKASQSAFRLQLLIQDGKPVSGVDWDDRDSIYERMDNR